MPTPIKPTKSVAPIGNHIGRVYSVVHMGVIDGEFKGVPNQIDKIRIGFELPNELHEFKEGEGEKPYVVSEEYSFMMGKKSNLRPIVEGIIGAQLKDEEAYSFEINDLMGRACMVNIIHNDNGYAKITATAPLPKGVEAPAAVNEPFYLDYEENWSEERFESLPAFIRDKMKTSHNYINKFRDEDEPPFPNEKHIELESLEDMDFSTGDTISSADDVIYDPKD